MREADSRGWERFHLVGYSGGGASALAVAARRPDRLLSLALPEPAWAGDWDLSEDERAVWREFEKLDALTPDEFMPRSSGSNCARASPRLRRRPARRRPG